MINKNILIIASNIKNYGLSGKFTHYISMKSKKCGDTIKIELTKKDNKIQSMRYETESCIYCNASASLMAKQIRGLSIAKAKKDLNKLRSFAMNLKSFQIPIKFKKFQYLFRKTNINRLNCIFLPLDAVLKALK